MYRIIATSESSRCVTAGTAPETNGGFSTGSARTVFRFASASSICFSRADSVGLIGTIGSPEASAAKCRAGREESRAGLRPIASPGTRPAFANCVCHAAASQSSSARVTTRTTSPSLDNSTTNGRSESSESSVRILCARFTRSCARRGAFADSAAGFPARDEPFLDDVLRRFYGGNFRVHRPQFL